MCSPSWLCLVETITWRWRPYVSVVAAASLKGNYSLERNERESFLLRKRGEMLRQRLHAANNWFALHARQDPLTAIPNRRYLDEFLLLCWKDAVQRRQPLSLLIIDIDHFKVFNDRYGHQGGDECLKVVAQTLLSCVRRPADLAARWGGEEFAVVHPIPTATRQRKSRSASASPLRR